jgi:16S rRNA (guanine966-N2)-methyltransferase
VLPGDSVRPTRARVRAALFAILGGEIAAARVLDLFAGSGALGAEAISRGAVFALFVEVEPRALAALEENRRRLGLLAQSAVIAIDLYRSTPPASAPFDLILLDPPFDDLRARDPARDPWEVIERVAAACLRPGGRVAMETPKGTTPRAGAGIEWEPPRRYGATELHLGRRR